MLVLLGLGMVQEGVRPSTVEETILGNKTGFQEMVALVAWGLRSWPFAIGTAMRGSGINSVLKILYQIFPIYHNNVEWQYILSNSRCT